MTGLRSASLVLAAMLLAIPTVAAADRSDPAAATPERDREARDHFQRGSAYFDVGSYERALDEFRRAYGLSHRALLLYNISLCYEHLGQNREAADALERYLRADRDLSARERRTHEQHVRELRSVRSYRLWLGGHLTPALWLNPIDLSTLHLSAEIRYRLGTALLAAEIGYATIGLSGASGGLAGFATGLGVVLPVELGGKLALLFRGLGAYEHYFADAGTSSYLILGARGGAGVQFRVLPSLALEATAEALLGLSLFKSGTATNDTELDVAVVIGLRFAVLFAP